MEAAAASGRPALRLKAVGRTYGSGPTAVDAVKDVDLEIWPGEFVVLLGPSGSGKTTMLNLVGGIEEPTCGRILVSGKDIAALNARQRTAYRRDQVGFVFQYFNLVPTLTALENVEIIAELSGKQVARRSRKALTTVGLADLADRFPGQMSGGQQQRVAIARAIVKEPPLLLCDEPTGSLDLVTGREVLAVLRELAREGRRTVVLVTHNSAIARLPIGWAISSRTDRLAGSPTRRLRHRSRGGGYGRLRRLQDRRRRRRPGCGDGDGPFHVVALAGTKLDLIRQRPSSRPSGAVATPVIRCMASAASPVPACTCCPPANTTGSAGGDVDEHLAVKVAWSIYQKIIAAYADHDRPAASARWPSSSNSIRRGVPAGLEEIAQLGRTLWRRRADILAFFDHHASKRTHRSDQRPPGSTAPRTHSDSATSPTTAGAHCCTAAPCTHSSMHSELRRAS